MWTHISHMQKYQGAPRCTNSLGEKWRSGRDPLCLSVFLYCTCILRKDYVMIITSGTLCLQDLFVPAQRVSMFSVLTADVRKYLYKCHPDKLQLLHCTRRLKSSSPCLLLLLLLYLSPSRQQNSMY